MCVCVCVTGLLLGMGQVNVRLQRCFVFGLGQSGDTAWPTVPMTMIHCDTTPVGGFCVHVCKNMQHMCCQVNENLRYGTGHTYQLVYLTCIVGQLSGI